MHNTGTKNNLITAVSILLFGLAFAPQAAYAHELWVLTAAQVSDWNSRAKPDVYTSFTLATTLIIVVTLAINVVLIQLHRHGANELFPALRAKLRSFRPMTSVVLRFCLGWVLLSSAFALEPRFGNAILAEPALLAPDLVLSDTSSSWQWLLGLEISLGIAMLLGIYVRLAAIGTVVLIGGTMASIGFPSIAYAPSFLGVAFYLAIAGAGTWYLPLPVFGVLKKFSPNSIGRVTISRAQIVLRVLAGINFLYLAIYFKVLQPNLTLAIIDVHQLPVMGFNPEVFVLVMAATEITIGLLMIFGVLLRFLSVLLIGAFVFFAICLSQAENLTSHMLYYGVAISFLINGNGRWRFPVAKDHPATIAILGSGLEAVAAIKQLEKLIPDASNIKLILISNRTDYQFVGMLPEVVSGAIPPTSVTHSFTKLLAHAELRLANVTSIDTENQMLHSTDQDDITYDQLIFAPSDKPDSRLQHSLQENIYELNTANDALRLKSDIIRQAVRSTSQSKNTNTLSTFAIFGGGERGSALAIEIRSLIESLKVERLVNYDHNPKIVVFEDKLDTDQLSAKLKDARAKILAKSNIAVVNARAIKDLKSRSVTLTSGASLNMGTVVNLRLKAPLELLPKTASQVGDLFDQSLELSNCENVWMASLSQHSVSQATREPGIRQRRLSSRILQAEIAAYNAWAISQGLEPRSFKKHKQRVYAFYMGSRTLATYNGLPIPGPLVSGMRRLRFLSLTPTLKHKLRISIDWFFGFVFGNDHTVLIESDTMQWQDTTNSIESDVETGSNPNDDKGPRQRAA